MSKVKQYTIDFRNAEHFLQVHFIIKEALNFPDYYGCNWDAFWDCLTEMYGDPMHIQILGLDVIERKFGGYEDKMIEILKRFKHFCNDKFSKDIKIEIIKEDTRTVLS